eukprot:1624478-Pyramimonas_sp.AAC.1
MRLVAPAIVCYQGAPGARLRASPPGSGTQDVCIVPYKVAVYIFNALCVNTLRRTAHTARTALVDWLELPCNTYIEGVTW